MTSLDSLNVDDAQVVWRYFDFPKLVHLLESGSLFFSRLDLLGDPFEGSVSKADLSALTQQWIARSQESGTPAGYYELEHRQRSTDPRHSLFVSCWHMSEVESVAMWRLYAGDMKGIALKSTAGKIRAQLPQEGKIRRVRYIDYGVDKTLHLSPAYCKRKAFDYEREVRAVIPSDANSSSAGIPVKIDINACIDEIRVSPELPSWIGSLIQQLLTRYGIIVPCLPSLLDEQPQFDWVLEDDAVSK